MKRTLLLGFTLAMALSPALKADERAFNFVEEAEVTPRGGLEFEQWITHRSGRDQGIYSRFDFKQELEYGFSEKLGASLVANSKSVYSSVYDPLAGADVDTEEFAFEGLGAEVKYLCLSPRLNWLGLLLYGEAGYNGPELELEAKLILEHEFADGFVWGLNLEAENEYAYQASAQSLEGKLTVATGLAWVWTPGMSIGLEARNQRIWPEWSREAASAWYAGPTLHVAGEKAWINVSVTPQLSGKPETLTGDGRELTENERVITRLILGFNF